MKHIATLLFFLFGFTIGLRLPDIDQTLPFLLHRSIVTHGLLLPLVLFGLALASSQSPLRLFVIGLCIASALHLVFDLFPRAWVGLALIHIPGIGYTSAAFSWAWLAISIVACLYIAFFLVLDGLEVALTVAGLLIGFGYLAAAEQVFWSALVALLIAATLALALPSHPAAVMRRLRSPQALHR